MPPRKPAARHSGAPNSHSGSVGATARGPPALQQGRALVLYLSNLNFSTRRNYLHIDAGNNKGVHQIALPPRPELVLPNHIRNDERVRYLISSGACLSAALDKCVRRCLGAATRSSS